MGMTAPAVAVATPTLVYVAIPDRRAFDEIKATTFDHTALFKPKPLLTKIIDSDEGVTVIFQHWLEQPR